MSELDHPRPSPGSPVGGVPVRRPGSAPTEQELAELVRGVAGVARVAAESSWRLAQWSARASVAGTQYLMRKAVAGESATAIIQDAATDLRAAALRALGITVPAAAGPGRPSSTLPAGGNSQGPASWADAAPTTAELRRRGAELMRLSNDVHFREDIHPAFARILGEITPDEARILRFLYVEGPQPAIDIRTNRPLGIGSELVATNLNMIGEHAGCRNLNLVVQYLTNLERLGLLDYSPEPVGNPQRYQVVEAQPKVAEAMRRAGRMPRTVHRSIALNDFGRAFCETCLPVGDIRLAPR